MTIKQTVAALSQFLGSNAIPATGVSLTIEFNDPVMARAAIEAMREPTDEMVEAGEKEFFEHLPDAKDWSLLYTKEAWQAMIAATLEGK